MVRTLFACYFERYWHLFLMSVVRRVVKCGQFTVPKFMLTGSIIARKASQSA